MDLDIASRGRDARPNLARRLPVGGSYKDGTTPPAS
jgi:hypothetical protein